MTFDFFRGEAAVDEAAVFCGRSAFCFGAVEGGAIIAIFGAPLFVVTFSCVDFFLMYGLIIGVAVVCVLTAFDAAVEGAMVQTFGATKSSDVVTAISARLACVRTFHLVHSSLHRICYVAGSSRTLARLRLEQERVTKYDTYIM